MKMKSDTDSDNPSAKVKSRKPPNTAFRQQRLKAWQPILTPKTVLPIFFCVAIVFAPIGALLLYASGNVQEIIIDYSSCDELASSSLTPIPSSLTRFSFQGGKTPSTAPSWQLVNAGSDSPVCRIHFEVANDMGQPVYLFYRLTNFYQNHRRYVTSYDENQLNGKAVPNNSLSDCSPLQTNEAGKAYYPCGLIANSYFNDTFGSPVLLNAPGSNRDNTTYLMTDKGIAWSTDKNRFQKTQYSPDQIAPPPNWAKRYPNGYTAETPPPDISEWESLQNWMRTAGLPTFSKLALRNDTHPVIAGTYSVDVGLNFPVKRYKGTKSLVFTTSSVVGGKNPFLGITYLIVAGICLFLGLLFLAKHLFKPRKLGDHTYLSWNNETPTAVSSGVNRMM